MEKAEQDQAELKRLMRDNKALAKALRAAKKEAMELREDREEAVDMAHRLLAKHYPALPYLREKKGNLFLLGREMLRKHGRLEEAGE